MEELAVYNIRPLGCNAQNQHLQQVRRNRKSQSRDNADLPAMASEALASSGMREHLLSVPAAASNAVCQTAGAVWLVASHPALLGGAAAQSARHKG